jgi:hypothetical protein
MNTDEIIEAAIQGHASTRYAIRWAVQQEREACAKVCDKEIEEWGWDADVVDVGRAIRARVNE